MARIARVVVPDFPHPVLQRGTRTTFGLVNDWREYLTHTDEHNSTNYELHLGTGRPLGTADFLDQLEQVIGTSLRRKKGD